MEDAREIDYSEDSTMRFASTVTCKLRWNGCQIRNTYEMALNLATTWEARRDGKSKPRLLGSHFESIRMAGRLEGSLAHSELAQVQEPDMIV